MPQTLLTLLLASCAAEPLCARGPSLLQTQPTQPTQPTQATQATQATPQQPKLIFFAGLEETGHHFWKELLPHLGVKGSTKFCTALYQDREDGALFGSEETPEWTRASRALVEVMKEAKQNVSSAACKAVAVNVHMASRSCGMMSFPNKNLTTSSPDLVLLRKLAEEAGLDLGVVLLSRPFQSLVNAEVARGFEDHRRAAAKKLSMNLAFLGEQLELLKPSEVMCWDFQEPTKRAKQLWRFLGSCGDAATFESLIVEIFQKPKATETQEIEEMMLTGIQLQEKLHAKWCA